MSKIIVIDYGAKSNIMRHAKAITNDVEVVTAQTTAKDILAKNPSGIILSNGPGDPSAMAYALPIIRELYTSGTPIFGICLGHQLLALAMGAKTKKMRQGHRGANHPIKNLLTGKVEITSQNHGFVVDDDGLPDDLEVTHRSLFDQTIAGIACKNGNAFAVQYHPESSPGPHDSHYLFTQFAAMLT